MHETMHCRGFSLVEMAVALVLVGLLSSGLMLPLSAEMERRAYSESRQQIEEIKAVLMGFAMVHGRLPCPADPLLKTDVSGAGLERTNCSTAVTGVVPWLTLGLKETDPWGRRITYRVAPAFADAFAASTLGCTPPKPPMSASFALCSSGNMRIENVSGISLASDIPVVVVSHGKNGAGAYLPTGIKLTASTFSGEKKNSDAGTTFVYDTRSNHFDDEVGWIPGYILFNRMVAAGKLP